MGRFNRDNRDGGNRFGKRDFGGRNFGGDRKFGGGGRFGKPEMHDATCSQCGKPCQVPFRPSGDREIFCNDCFKDKKHDRPMRSGSNFDKPRFDSRPSFDKKPSFGGGNGNSEQFKQQFEALNSKLDKILKALSSATESRVEQVEKPAEEVKKTKETSVKSKSTKKSSTKKKK